jgi:glutamate racemase
MARNLSSAFTNARLQSQASVPISNIVKNAAKPQEQQVQEQVHADEEKEGKLRLVYVLAQRDTTLDATIRMNVTDIINANIRKGIQWGAIKASKLAGRGEKGGIVEPIIRQLCKWYKEVSRKEVLRKYRR